MGRARQTFERRQLGLTLRRLRADAGKSQQEAAATIGKARSRVVQLEDGEGTPAAADLDALLEFYEVADEEGQAVRALAAEARKRQGRRAHVDLLPHAYQRFADLEASAETISSYEPAVIPGLLQSPNYVQAVISECDGHWWTASADEIDERCAFRLRRQAEVFGAVPAKSLQFVISEAALRSVAGERRIRVEQLRHILELSDRHERLEVRVLETGAAHNACRGGGLTVFGFGERGGPVGFCSVVAGPSTYFDDVADTGPMMQAFEAVRRNALGVADSLDVISRMVEEES